MVDTKALQARHDLRVLVEQDLGPAPVRSRKASLWKCPFHGERKGHSLVVWADGYRCFGKCQVAGDVLDWLQRYRGLEFREAVRVLDGEVEMTAPPARVAERSNDAPPPSAWQVAARQVVEQAEEALWSSQGEGALAYLLGRGLTLETIRVGQLGYVAGTYRQWRSVAGLSVPCGIVIPWLSGETLWQVKVRRAAGSPKYVQIAGGSSGGLYQADYVSEARAVLFCEGEFDAMLAQQEAGELVAAVTLGSASSTLGRRWLAELVRVPILLVAYDMDEAGRRGEARLLALSRRAYPVHLPWGKDLTEYHRQGGDLFAWLADELRQVRQKAFCSRERK